MKGSQLTFGVLLPHFGTGTSGRIVVDAARRAEELGFSSVWVRDHVIYEPNETVDPPGAQLLDALATLSAAGHSTSSVRLGMGCLTPTRHPLTVAQFGAALSEMVGGRLTIGIGAGSSDREFAALGLESTRLERVRWVAEYIEVLRLAWMGGSFDYSGRRYSFSGARIGFPVAPGDISIWYCGTSPASVRAAVAMCDGWMPGRIPLRTFDERVKSLHRQAEASGVASPVVSCRPLVIVSDGDGLSIDPRVVAKLTAYANSARLWVRPPSGAFETLADLEGMVVTGSPDSIADSLARLRSSGCEHVVFDLRTKPASFLATLEVLGREVLPRFR